MTMIFINVFLTLIETKKSKVVQSQIDFLMMVYNVAFVHEIY